MFLESLITLFVLLYLYNSTWVTFIIVVTAAFLFAKARIVRITHPKGFIIKPQTEIFSRISKQHLTVIRIITFIQVVIAQLVYFLVMVVYYNYYQSSLSTMTDASNPPDSKMIQNLMRIYNLRVTVFELFKAFFNPDGTMPLRYAAALFVIGTFVFYHTLLFFNKVYYYLTINIISKLLVSYVILPIWIYYKTKFEATHRKITNYDEITGTRTTLLVEISSENFQNN